MDDGRLIIKNNFEYMGKSRVNIFKIIDYGDFIQIYINNGNTKNGFDKYAQFRLDKVKLKSLKEWLNKLE